jgi:amidase
MDVAFRPAVQLAADILAKRIGARELLEVYLRRIERYDGQINAVVVKDFDRARRRADEADKALARGGIWGPLHGLPMTVKESCPVAGLPTTRGSPDLKNNVAADNMVAVDRLLRAGAVIFGKTNVPLMLAEWQSFNDVYGTTNNPWDLSRTPGGSSGGSAAALAAGLTALELGSDVGGSIRNPAHFCGIYGHKPTHGIVPQRGHELGGKIAPRDIQVMGPMARTPADLEACLRVVAGPDDADGDGWRLELPQPGKKKLREYRVAVMFDAEESPVDTSIKDQLQSLAGFLAKQGAVVREMPPPIDTGEALRVFVKLVRATAAGRLTDATFEKELEYLKGTDRADESFRTRVSRANTMSHRDWHAASEARHKMRMRWADFFREWDVLLCPAASTVATKHDQKTSVWDQKVTVNGKSMLSTNQYFWTGYAAVSLLPVTVAPIGTSPEGLPVGVQIVGPQYGDLKTIHFASLLERDYRGFVAPPKFVSEGC